jgi:hypothetical protein
VEEFYQLIYNSDSSLFVPPQREGEFWVKFQSQIKPTSHT